MARSKRPYVPKTRGCYECSQRRINCDNSRPVCNKCSVRGIRCSGYGVRYRFKTDPHVNGDLSLTREPEHDQKPSINQSLSESSGDPEPVLGQAQSEDGNLIIRNGNCPTPLPPGASHSITEGSYLNEGFGSNRPRRTDHSIQIRADINATISIDSILGPKKPWKQYFLTYFSQKIAAEMVAVDDHRNGWRHLVLPIAQQDDLVEEAVLAAAAFHFAANVDVQFLKPITLYQGAIQKLRLRQDMTAYDLTEQQTILLSLLVLLVAAVVSGSSDFRTIFGLLEGALHALGGEERMAQGELGKFVIWQVRKYRGWMSPHLSLERGVRRLNQSVSKPYKSEGWEDISYNCRLYPKFESSWSIIYQLNEQACNIYVTRALAHRGTPPRIDLVDRFIETLKLLPADSPGMYLVPWTIFLAAAESSEPNQRQFFSDILLKHSKRNGFANLPLALRFLQELWSGTRCLDWTEALAELPVFVV